MLGRWRAVPNWVAIVVFLCLQLGLTTLTYFVMSRSWARALTWAVDMVALVYGTAWWARWRDRQRGTPGARPRWVRPALVTYLALLAGLLLTGAPHWHRLGRDLAVSAAVAAMLVAILVGIYTHGLSKSRDVPPPKSRVKA